MQSLNELWVLDTHIWIRILGADPRLSRPEFLASLEERAGQGALRLSAISLWETSMLAAKGRLTLTLPLRDWLAEAVKMPGLSLVALGPEISAESCLLPGDFHGDPADRIIVATARHLDAVLVTLDQAILDFGATGWLRTKAP